jgi:uncharacterized OB-fold protein
MTLTDKVQERVARLPAETAHTLALVEAERLADMFADIKPTPYSVPIERYVGMKVECRFKATTASED